MIGFGCAHTLKPGEQADLLNEAHETLARMVAKDPNLRSVLDGAVGYIMFPRVGQGGFIVGGGAGNGVVFEGGQHTGFARMEQAAFGALVGGQSFSELVIVNEKRAFDDLKSGRFDFGARASAVILRTGAASGVTFENGVAVVIDPIKGAMANASLSGTRIRKM
jgi:lipid-binding SYLF domain-containing protein